MQLTDEQMRVRDNEGKLLVVGARAGSGKTATMVALIRKQIAGGIDPESILAITFTVAAAREIQQRLGVELGHVGTLHSFVMRHLATDRATIADDTEVAALVAEAFANLSIRGLSTKQVLAAMEDVIDPPGDVGVVVRYVCTDLRARGQTTFSLMLRQFLAEMQAGVHMRKFSLLVVDEAQDTAPIDAAIYDLIDAATRVFIGDSLQCQPAETLVDTKGGPKRIDDLQDGEKVNAYDRHSGRVTGGHKIEVASRNYSGPMLTVKAGDHETRCTPNHRWLARWTDRKVTTCVTYLMWREGYGYRIGWCQLFAKKNQSLHFFTRCRIEQADKAWILRVHESRTDASVDESITATNHKIPTATFEPVTMANHLTRETIDRIFDGSGCHDASSALLEADRLEEHPFYEKDPKRSRGTFMELAATNLIPGLHSVPSRDGSWNPVRISRKSFEGKVYSLNVAKHHSYVADGIVTLNCIYGFRGCDDRFFRRMARRATDFLTLSTTFRCRKAICVAANRLFPQATAMISAHVDGAGYVEAIRYRNEADELKGVERWAKQCNGTRAVLCRYKADVDRVAAWLRASGMKVRQRRAEADRGTVAALRFLLTGSQPHAAALMLELGARAEKVHSTLSDSRADAMNGKALAVVLADMGIDRATAAEAAPHGVTLTDALEAALRGEAPGLPDPAEVIVGTIHSAKGREFDDVLVAACYAPGKRADEDEEARIFYVGITRARNSATVTFAERRIDPRTFAELAGVPSPFIAAAGIRIVEKHLDNRY